MRRLQILIGLVLAAGAAVGVMFVGQASKPPTYEVIVVADEVPAYTRLEAGLFALDVQSVSPNVAGQYVLRGELDEMLAAGAVAVENLHRNQPLLRVQVASGAEAGGLSRLAVALTDPERVIVSVPIKPEDTPGVYPGDVVALFYSAGSLQAQKLATDVIELRGDALPTPAPAFTPTLDVELEPPYLATTTVEAKLPLTKWVANGVVYRLNRETTANPNYGAPGMEAEPRYIQGELRGVDVVIHRDDAEWVAFALAHGKVQVAVLPAVTRPDVEAGAFAPSQGVTWSDLEERFWSERPEYVEGHLPRGLDDWLAGSAPSWRGGGQ